MRVMTFRAGRNLSRTVPFSGSLAMNVFFPVPVFCAVALTAIQVAFVKTDFSAVDELYFLVIAFFVAAVTPLTIDTVLGIRREVHLFFGMFFSEFFGDVVIIFFGAVTIIAGIIWIIFVHEFGSSLDDGVTRIANFGHVVRCRM